MAPDHGIYCVHVLSQYLVDSRAYCPTQGRPFAIERIDKTFGPFGLKISLDRRGFSQAFLPGSCTYTIFDGETAKGGGNNGLGSMEQITVRCLVGEEICLNMMTAVE